MDLQQAFDHGFSAVKAYVDREFEAFEVRMAALEARQPERGERGLDGANGRDGVDGANGADGKDGAPGLDGAAGLDGKDGTDGVAGRDGVDGKDAEPIAPEQITEAVRLHLAANPPASGKDGQDGINGKDGQDGVDGARGEDGIAGKDGADGINGRDGADGLSGKDGINGKDGAPCAVVAGAIKDHSGELILTLTDGTMLKTGLFDGRDGQAGADGLGFDNLDCVYDGARTITLRMTRGDTVKAFEFVVPVVLDAGPYRSESAYAKGDAVSFGGSLWIAQRETSDKPETSDAWRLAVKRGRDGKDGVLKATPDRSIVRVPGAATGPSEA